MPIIFFIICRHFQREVISSRWPYPITEDAELLEVEEASKETGGKQLAKAENTTKVHITDM